MIKFFKHVLTLALSIVTLVFTFVPEALFGHCKLFPNASDEVNIMVNRVIFTGIVVVFVTIGYVIYRRCRKKVCIKGKNYSIKVSYGDIFDLPACKKVIPFDECFSTEVGHEPAQVKPSSICGQYLTKYPIADIHALIDKAQLKPYKGKSKYNNQERYEPGRLVPNGNYLLMAFTKLDKDGLGRMTRDEYLECLSILWQEIDKHYGQTDVCISILGSGTTRIGDNELTQQELLDMIIGSYKLSANKLKVPSTLHIVCKRRDDFSLNRIGEHL